MLILYFIITANLIDGAGLSVLTDDEMKNDLELIIGHRLRVRRVIRDCLHDEVETKPEGKHRTFLS